MDTSTIEILREIPLSPASKPGPFRKRDYLALPDEPRCELIFGWIYEVPSPTYRHQTVSLLIWQRLHEIAKRTGGAASAAPLDVTLADHSVVQPDVIYVSAARLHVIEERIEGAPDLLVEVLSPGTERRDRSEKLRIYAESGVREYWLVDPKGHITFLVNREGRFQVELPVDDRYRSAELPEIELDLADLWRELDPSVPPSTG
jgi:Uma2 family endonuclease